MGSILEMKKIEKTFNNSIRALQGADLFVSKGEIHAIVGENAAGKSTLMNILYGSVHADSGEIIIDGKPCRIEHPADAISLGIGMVHQHFKLVPDFTVLENIILGYEKKYTNVLKKIDYGKARKDIEALLRKINVELDLDRRTDSLSIGIQSKIEIVKTLFKGANIIILDEPTTVLAPNEVGNFFDFLRSLSKQGCTIIYISHRMKEIFALSDSITVLRHGKTVCVFKTSETCMEEVASKMIGREYTAILSAQDSPKAEFGEPVLELENVSVRKSAVLLNDISLTVRKGEILGIAGIEGNGQVELADALIGVLKNERGRILLNQEDLSRRGPSERRKKGLSYVPDDRIRKGLALDMSITENAVIGHEQNAPIKMRKHFMDWQNAKSFTKQIAEEYRVEGMARPEQKISNLSGGNMQKLIIGREMIRNPPMVVLAQPTSGVDFSAQKNIHDKILEMREKGSSFLLISEDLDELMALSDRILVLYRGSIVAEFNSKESFDEKQLGYYMTGVKGNEA
ncbi:Ribose import ATP-binding protein RbsA [bioreactor metagenome]|uniref:Ribose import ATP-binding protein RbsA n=1 Tax=bioreactor metagenome TaxID=1076179 RepID=A0A644VZ68_9ZZZZ